MLLTARHFFVSLSLTGRKGVYRLMGVAGHLCGNAK